MDMESKTRALIQALELKQRFDTKRDMCKKLKEQAEALMKETDDLEKMILVRTGFPGQEFPGAVMLRNAVMELSSHDRSEVLEMLMRLHLNNAKLNDITNELETLVKEVRSISKTIDFIIDVNHLETFEDIDIDDIGEEESE